jgi:[ribosomal protein S18]-alanine N-acetyltransferase
MESIREFLEQDLPALNAIEQASHPDPWSIQMLHESCVGEGYIGLVSIEEPDTVAGFCCARMVAGEIEIVNLAVVPSRRRTGIASGLIRYLIAYCRNKQVHRILLEVRDTNNAALSLYKKAGFAEDGIRREYYSNKDNAILMSLQLLERFR